jgi:hypothetical protein
LYVEGVVKVGFSSFTVREDHALGVFGTGCLGEYLYLERGKGWRKFHEQELKNLSSSLQLLLGSSNE